MAAGSPGAPLTWAQQRGASPTRLQHCWLERLWCGAGRGSPAPAPSWGLASAPGPKAAPPYAGRTPCNLGAHPQLRSAASGVTPNRKLDLSNSAKGGGGEANNTPGYVVSAVGQNQHKSSCDTWTGSLLSKRTSLGGLLAPHPRGEGEGPILNSPAWCPFPPAVHTIHRVSSLRGSCYPRMLEGEGIQTQIQSPADCLKQATWLGKPGSKSGS